MEKTAEVAKKNYAWWIDKMIWACDISISILKNVNRDLPKKQLSIAYLEGMKLAFSNAHVGLSVLPAQLSCDPQVQGRLLDEVLKPLESIRMRCTSSA